MARLLGGESGRISRNIVWLTGERLLNLTVSLMLSVWLARYLGPADFGIYNYVIAFVSLFGFLTVLGLDGIATRELVLAPERRNVILGTTLALRLLGSGLAILTVLLLAAIVVDVPDVRLLIAVAALGMFFEAFAVIDAWFNSRTEARFSVLARTSTVAFAGLATALLLFARAPLVAFVLIVPLRQLVKAACFTFLYRRTGNRVLSLRSDWGLAFTYLKESWPLILAFASALIYLKIDQVMLGNMMDSTAVGIYSVAARLSESWYFLGPAIGISVFPSIVMAKRESEASYRLRLQKLYALMAWLAIVVAVSVTLTAHPLVHLLFGAQYAASVPVLAIHIWTCPAVFMGAILTKWLINERLYMFALTRNLLGAIANIGLNLVLIPQFGVLGSALATLVSYTLAHYLACFTDARTRPAAMMMTKALVNPLQAFRSERKASEH